MFSYWSLLISLVDFKLASPGFGNLSKSGGIANGFFLSIKNSSPWSDLFLPCNLWYQNYLVDILILLTCSWFIGYIFEYMKIAILGNGGREHAIATKISKSTKLQKLYCIPGNAGTDLIAENVGYGDGLR